MIRMFQLAVLFMLCASHATAARRPASADFAPDRWRFQTLEASGIGRELPFVYDVPTAAKQAANDPRTTYETWIGLGLQAYREEIHDVAAGCFRAALTISNRAPTAVRHLLARSLLFADRPSDAEGVWSEICGLDPSDAEARWQLGYSLFLRDDLDAAMEQWTRVEKLAKEHPLPPLMLGLVHWSLLQYGAAQRELITSTRRPQAPSHAFLALSAIALQQDDLPESVGWLRRAFDRIPQAERARWFHLPAFAKLRQGRGSLVAGLIKEFKLDDPTVASHAADGRGDNVRIEADRPYQTSIGLAGATGNTQSTNEVPDIRLRLGPRIDTLF